MTTVNIPLLVSSTINLSSTFLRVDKKNENVIPKYNCLLIPKYFIIKYYFAPTIEYYFSPKIEKKPIKSHSKLCKWSLHFEFAFITSHRFRHFPSSSLSSVFCRFPSLQVWRINVRSFASFRILRSSVHFHSKHPQRGFLTFSLVRSKGI